LARNGVLVTRPEPGASETAQRLLALSYHPVLAPLLRVRRLEPALPLDVSAVLVTSGNAVPCLPASLYSTPLLAVGNATADRARAAGFAHVLSADGDAAALAELTRQVCRPGAALLLATARQQGGSLAATLRAAGFVVHRRAVYAAKPVDRMPQPALQALQGGSLAAALFLSAETARAFARLLPPQLLPALAEVEALAIGQPTAEALRFLPWRRVRVSAKPTQDSILAML
jgi:uroporphyrinogen-III synthase